jgi:hypothetical protein
MVQNIIWSSQNTKPKLSHKIVSPNIDICLNPAIDESRGKTFRFWKEKKIVIINMKIVILHLWKLLTGTAESVLR